MPTMQQHWRYFVSLEKDFIETLDYAELSPNNAHTFSNEYAKLLLLIGSEVDVVAKMLCAQISPGANRENIVDYREVIIQNFPGMHEIEIEIVDFNRAVKPWLDWDPAARPPRSPSWWKAYNNVKHERDRNFSQADQDNTLSALCGLFALLLYLHRGLPHPQPHPTLVNFGFPKVLTTEGSKALPGISYDPRAHAGLVV
jgi:hypothetical protein